MTLVKNVGKFVAFTEVTLLNRKPCLGVYRCPVSPVSRGMTGMFVTPCV